MLESKDALCDADDIDGHTALTLINKHDALSSAGFVMYVIAIKLTLAIVREAGRCRELTFAQPNDKVAKGP